uniref:Uncharacterized protein n=1 Tax=Manihot esculenta TaxID=3983 RepID=A0A2C9UYZ7_MANES
MVGFGLANFWLAHSKLGVEPWDSSEGLALLVPRAEGTALGWLHRAATTSRSWQWKDYRPVVKRVRMA